VSATAAEDVARSLLATDQRERWAHVCGVARRASRLRMKVGDDGPLLVCAAWLHDSGYGRGARRTGFHPVDGALFLRDAGCSDRLCSLVAHHSAAAVEALYFGCIDHLQTFPDERTLTRDLLWYCDMTIGPQGQPVSFKERMDEVRFRYGTDSYVTAALDASMPERAAAVTRAETWIESVGLAGQV
jgi:hypothetical protein